MQKSFAPPLRKDEKSRNVFRSGLHLVLVGRCCCAAFSLIPAKPQLFYVAMWLTGSLQSLIWLSEPCTRTRTAYSVPGVRLVAVTLRGSVK